MVFSIIKRPPKKEITTVTLDVDNTMHPFNGLMYGAITDAAREISEEPRIKKQKKFDSREVLRQMKNVMRENLYLEHPGYPRNRKNYGVMVGRIMTEADMIFDKLGIKCDPLDFARLIEGKFNVSLHNFYREDQQSLGLAEAIRYLQNEGMTVGTISNSPMDMMDFYRGLWVERGIEIDPKHVTVSEETGLRKPKNGIFFYAAGKMRSSVPNICHFGDNSEHDIEGPREAGYGDQVLVTGYSVPPHDFEGKAIDFLNVGNVERIRKKYWK
ncbi:MAG: HAD family hydrolase [Candidatus Aenigmarchaeota archaeon]|nr:HAD family hydrolase [Candidatus Aenigmarchaeota archaeon]